LKKLELKKEKMNDPQAKNKFIKTLKRAEMLVLSPPNQPDASNDADSQTVDS
jgi:hypothetical protein